jgi:spore germination protein YaaH
MHDLPAPGSRPIGRMTALVAAVFASALLVIAPLAPGPLAAPVARATDPGIQSRVKGIAPLGKQVYGYLPYWRLDAGTAGRLDYDLVSTVAFFGLGVKKDGNIDTAWRGYTAYMSDNAVAVTNAAHAKGVRVVPTFQLFDSGTLVKMKAFLHSKAAQARFIRQALALMERRSADGANFDFEPMPQSLSLDYAKFLGKFKTAMRKQFPTAKLVAATSAGAPYTLIVAIAPIVDQMLVMTYNYRWSGSTVTGAIAPLDNTTRTVKLHIARYLKKVPPSKLILGVPYYGYDWPVTSAVPNAAVQKTPSKWGGVWSVSFASAHNWLAAHPDVVLQHDTSEGSAYFTYWDTEFLTFRQVYFEDELSAAAKYDYAIATGLAGVGIWTLDNDRGYNQLNDVLRAKFYNPTHRATVGAAASKVTRSAGSVKVTHVERVKNVGNIPERGSIVWRIFDSRGRLVKKGSLTVTIYPGATRKLTTTTILGTPASLRPGTYRLKVQFVTNSGVWKSPTDAFKQPY